jgi:hypothetical protein
MGLGEEPSEEYATLKVCFEPHNEAKSSLSVLERISVIVGLTI